MNRTPKAWLCFSTSIALSEASWVFRSACQPSEGSYATSHILDRQEDLKFHCSPPMVAETCRETCRYAETCRKGMGRKLWRFGQGWRHGCSSPCCRAKRGIVAGDACPDTQFSSSVLQQCRARGLSVSDLPEE